MKLLTLLTAPSLAFAITLSITPQTRHQTISGFGISEAFQRASGIVNLPPTQQRYALDLLFNTTSGAGFSILRNGIGSSTSSNSDWMNTILPVSPGSPSGTPKYVWDGKDSGQLFVTKEAWVRYGVRTVYANAWSAPGFMKSNGNDANGGTLKTEWRQMYADYLVKYIQIYASEGISVTHLGFLNEPDASTSYASMQSSGTQAADFIKVLAPTLAAANLSTVKIACCDAMGYGTTSTMLSQLGSAAALLGTITSHAYTGGPSTLSTSLPVWLSELADNNGAWTTAWYTNGGAGEGYTWANKIMDGITGANLSAYLYWIGAQERASTTNSKLIDIRNGVVSPSKRLWAFAHWGRWVRPGSVRVGSSGGAGVKTAAFLRGEGRGISVLVLNTGGSAITVDINISGFSVVGAKAWVTDNSRDMTELAVIVSAKGVVSGSVPARGMVTFVVDGVLV